MIIIMGKLMEKLWLKMIIPMESVVRFVVLILRLITISNKSCHVTGEYQLYAQQKIRNVNCFLGKHCARSWISYGLK